MATMEELEDRYGQDDDLQPSSELDRFFAIQLSELEDLATSLAQRQQELVTELGKVEAELQRVENVRAAMLGKPKAPKRRAPNGAPKPSPSGYTPAPEVQEKAKRVLAWARERGDEFTGGEAAEGIGEEPRGVGPMLAGMVSRGELLAREGGRSPAGRPTRLYRLPS